MIFYTYLWLREDGSPYYVGKGNGRRGYISGSHRLPCPKDLSRILIQEFPSEQDSIFAERFLIAYYGRIDLETGCLRNLTDGGEGTSGRVLSDKARARLRAANVGRKASPEVRRKLSISHKGKVMSEETRQRMSIAKKKQIFTEGQRAKMSLYARNRTDEHKRKLLESRYGKK